VEPIVIQPSPIETTKVTAPPVGGIESISIPEGESLKVPSFILGMSAVITGSFVDPLTREPYPESMVVIIQESANKRDWINVAVVNTDENGRYAGTVTPSRTGKVYYRAFFPGITSAVWGPPIVESYLTREEMLSRHGVVAPPIISEDVIELEVSSFSSAFAWLGGLAQVNQIQALADGTTEAINKLAQSTSDSISDLADSTSGSIDNLADSTSSSLDRVANEASGKLTEAASERADLSSQIQSVNAQVKSVDDGVKDLEGEVQDLRAQIGTLTTGIYAAIAIAVILGAVAIVMARRRS
jgi:hypothetical protein